MSKIKEKIKEVEEKVAELEALAEELGEGFHWEGPAYGMGGYYRTRKGLMTKEEKIELLKKAVEDLNATGVEVAYLKVRLHDNYSDTIHYEGKEYGWELSSTH